MDDFANIQEKQEKEKEELENKIKEMLASVTTKNERKRINKLAEQMRRDLFEKQSQETNDPFIQSIIDDSTSNTNEKPKNDPQVETDQAPQSNGKKKSQKDKERSRQQRQKKMQQRYKLESEVAQVANTKTKGQIELEKLNEQLKNIGLTMHQTIGDGHCLYRAIAYSLAVRGLSEYDDSKAYLEIRKKAANELRSKSSEYIHFSNCQTPEEFEQHCERVENSGDWGDDLELVALSNALKYSFVVHRVDQKPITRGDFDQSIDLAFLAYYTSSGGHYNAVVPYSE